MHDVADRSAEALRQRATRKRRLLQGELMAIIERALQESPTDAHASAMPATAPRLGGIVGFDRFGHPIATLELGLRYQLPAHDAACLWRAAELNAPIARLDEKRASAAKTHLASVP